MTLEFCVPGVPMTWKRTNVFNGRRITPREQREYQSHIAFCASVIKPSTWPMDREYAVTIHVVQAAKRGDIDNFSKNCLDALNEIAWNDDRQVSKLVVTREVDKKAPRLEVKVEVIQ